MHNSPFIQVYLPFERPDGLDHFDALFYAVALEFILFLIIFMSDTLNFYIRDEIDPIMLFFSFTQCARIVILLGHKGKRDHNS